MLQLSEADQLACPVKADEIANPAKHRNVGDGVVVAHDPGSLRKSRLDDGENALRLVTIAVKRALVLDLAASEFVKITDLAEDRAHRPDLEEQPLKRLVARRGIGGHELSRLLRKVEKNRTGFEERQRFA